MRFWGSAKVAEKQDRPAETPDLVRFGDVRALMETSPEGKLLVGLGPGGVASFIDLDQAAPHAGISMTAGMGQTVLFRSLLAQHFRQGGETLILNPVIGSPRGWLRDLPGVRYAEGREEIDEAAHWLRVEVAIRTDKWRAHSMDDPLSVPRLVVATERAEVLHWVSPSLDLPALTAIGRALRVHTVLGIQNPGSVRGLFRENLGVKVLAADADARTWHALAPECCVPKRSAHRGRAHVVAHGQATQVQTVFMTEDEARGYVTGTAL